MNRQIVKSNELLTATTTTAKWKNKFIPSAHLVSSHFWYDVDVDVHVCVREFFLCSYCSFDNIKIIHSRSRKFKSLILLNIHAKCGQKNRFDYVLWKKKWNFFLDSVRWRLCCAFWMLSQSERIKCRQTDTQTENENIRIHRWNGPYEYVNKWFFIQFTKQI